MLHCQLFKMWVDNKNQLTFTNGLPEQYFYAETPVQYYVVEVPVQINEEVPSQKNEDPILKASFYKPIVEKEPKIKKQISRKWILLIIAILAFLAICGVVLGLIPVYLNGE